VDERVLWKGAMSAIAVRPDLVEAQAAAWRHVTSPGGSWTGAERAAIAETALAALDDPDPLAPWMSPTSAGREMPAAEILPAEVVDAVYRIARHAATLTEDWYQTQIELGIDPFAYVEMVGVARRVSSDRPCRRPSTAIRTGSTPRSSRQH
jgi:hypothetical protein